MTERHPEEIDEAANLLKKFERSQDHSKRTNFFSEAVEILNSYLEAFPDSSQQGYISRIKLAYTKKLLEELPSLGAVDLIEWFSYIRLLHIQVTNEVDLLSKENKNLRRNVKQFNELYRDEVVALIKKTSAGDRL